MEFNIADLFESLVDVVPSRPAVVCGDRRLTFAELDERATRFANALTARGVKADVPAARTSRSNRARVAIGTRTRWRKH